MGPGSAAATDSTIRGRCLVVLVTFIAACSPPRLVSASAGEAGNALSSAGALPDVTADQTVGGDTSTVAPTEELDASETAPRSDGGQHEIEVNLLPSCNLTCTSEPRLTNFFQIAKRPTTTWNVVCHVGRPQVTSNSSNNTADGDAAAAPVGLTSAESSPVDACVIDVEEPMQEVLSLEEDFIYYLVFKCAEPLSLSFVNPRQVVNKNAIGYVWSIDCDIPWSELARYAASVDLRVLYLQGWLEHYDDDRLALEHDRHPDGLYRLPPSLSNIGTFLFSGSARQLRTPFPEMFRRFLWPRAVEIQFVNVSMEVSDVEQLRRTMPNLQSLELKLATLADPPAAFPWSTDWAQLPRNLTRTPNGNHHYARYITVVPNVYRRIYSLKGSGIRDLSNFTFHGLVQWIELSHNGLAIVGETTFRRVEGLQNLDLSHNKLTELPEAVFRGLNDLVILDLGHNGLTRLSMELFEDLGRLRHLVVANNELQRIERQTLVGLTSLKSLDASGNNLVYVDNYALDPNLETLTEVTLADNQLVRFPFWIFLVRNLIKIDLSNNNLTFDSFKHMLSKINVEEVIYQNRKSASSFDMDFVPSLSKVVNVQKNLVLTMDLDQLTFRQKVALEIIFKFFHMDFRENPFICDCSMFSMYVYLEDHPSLKNTFRCHTPIAFEGSLLESLSNTSFRCADTSIPSCPVGCTCYRRSLDREVEVECIGANAMRFPDKVPHRILSLSMRSNKLETLENTRPYFDQVQKLDLGENAIADISVAFLDGLTKVKTLLLDNNALKHFPESFKEDHLPPELQTLTLSGNPVACDCNDVWIKEWLIRHFRLIPDVQEIACASGSQQGQKLLEADTRMFVCERKVPGSLVSLAIALGAIIVVCFLVSLPVYRYRGEIKLVLYMRFRWRPFDRADEKEDVMDKVYDGFLSYHHTNCRWVCHELRKQLEEMGTPRYKLCIHDRDFMVGAPIVENILESVKTSRRMLMVVSRPFLQSEWCMAEFRLAHQKVLCEKTNYLIIILMEDVADEDLDEDMKLYFKTKTYLHVENKWFWDKLRLALPKIPLADLKRKLTTADTHTNGSVVATKGSDVIVMTPEVKNTHANRSVIATKGSDVITVTPEIITTSQL